MPRIIAGEKRGLKLEAPRGEATRPTGDRVKEAIFSILQAELRGTKFLDLFGGSGQIGLEAASRGASQVWIVEKDRQAAEIIRQNIQKCGFEESVKLMQAPASAALSRLWKAGELMDIIYFDPPWKEEARFFFQLRDSLLQIMHEHSRLLLETDESAEKELRDLRRKFNSLTSSELVTMAVQWYYFTEKQGSRKIFRLPSGTGNNRVSLDLSGKF